MGRPPAAAVLLVALGTVVASLWLLNPGSLLPRDLVSMLPRLPDSEAADGRKRPSGIFLPRPALTPEQRKHWMARHGADLAELQRRCAPGGAGLETLLLGDSITEGWLRPYFPLPPAYQNGTFPQLFRAGLPKVPALFRASFGPRAAAAAIGGDRVEELEWRLEHGLLAAIGGCRGQLRRVHVMIGTNDLAWGDKPETVLRQLERVAFQLARRLRQSEGLVPAKLTLQAVMPRAASRPGKFHSPERWAPRNPWFHRISAVNAGLRDLVRKLQGAGTSAAFVDCEDSLLRGGSRGEVVPQLFHDGLHPGLRGYKKWAECLRKAFGDGPKA